MTDAEQAPGGWYQQGTEERYWDGTQWTSHTRPLPPPVPQAYPQQPTPQSTPQKTSNTPRNVLLILLLLVMLALGGCAVLFSTVIIKETREEAANDKPTEVTVGEVFARDGFTVDDGWAVVPGEYDGVTIEGMTVTLDDDQDGGRTARFTFGLYDGKTVIGEIDCTSNEMHAGEMSRMDCNTADDVEIDDYKTIKVSDLW